MASTLANAGVCPITMDKVGVTATFKPHLYYVSAGIQPASRPRYISLNAYLWNV